MQHPTGEVTSVEVPPSVKEAGAHDASSAVPAEEHHDTFLGIDSYGWVGLAFVVFAALLWKLGALKGIGTALDARGERIRAELDQAKTLRAEAEAMLADAKARQAAGAKDADAIVAHARQEAAQIVDKAKMDAEAMIGRRTAMAEAKIGAAERAAEAELRARAATLATDAAAKLIAAMGVADAKSTLTDQAIAELDRRLN
jgi:F-type H+-transporting ATPase subunit b